ncbi:MAG: hypothetical protein JSU94_20675 [Phycisphaerales bacterium]|nr:MAG: hypothetical protein JSU94_20675 [Phycisphaerales bacterium]
MGMRYKFNVLAGLLPGEKVLFFKPWVWAASNKSLPSYRGFFSLPPLWEAGLYVTDRRVLFVAQLFRLVTQELDQWFEGKNRPGDDEVIKQVRVGKSRLFGPYVEIVSDDPVKRWYRSRRARLRFFMKQAESVCSTISEAMAKGAEQM